MSNSAFPTAIDTVANFGLLTNNFSTTLNGAITSGATSIVLSSAAAILSPGGFYLSIESEIIWCTGRTGNTATVGTRGALGTTAAGHADTTAVNMYIVNGNTNDLVETIITIETEIGKTSSPATTSLRYAVSEIADSVLFGGVQNIAANSTFIVGKGNGDSGAWLMPFNGKITAVTIASNAARTAGTCQGQILLNAVAQTGAGQFAQLDATNTQFHSVVLSTAINFNAGDRLDLQTVTAGFAPTGADVTVSLFWKRR